MCRGHLCEYNYLLECMPDTQGDVQVPGCPGRNVQAILGKSIHVYLKWRHSQFRCLRMTLWIEKNYIQVCVCVYIYIYICMCEYIYIGFPRGSAVKNLLQCRSCRRHSFHPWIRRRTCQPTSVFLLGKSLGQRSLAGHSTQGHIESNTAEVIEHAHTHTHTHTHIYIHADLSKSTAAAITNNSSHKSQSTPRTLASDISILLYKKFYI